MKKLLLLLCFAVFVLGCSSPIQKKEILPNVDIPVSEMNTHIRLGPSLGWRDIFASMGILTLELENLSSETVVFPSDFGLNIYVLNEQSWLPIANAFGYPSGDHFLPPEPEFPLGDLVHLVPVIPNPRESVTIRVVVVGAIEQTDLDVAAYYDIELAPLGQGLRPGPATTERLNGARGQPSAGSGDPRRAGEIPACFRIRASRSLLISP